ncbi:ATP-grasp domain-containing protein [Pseudoxanthomonas kalamensis]|uniref:ATP-grasp domain-containing protein n=1 Tax=Pseudoxanthomonas kalamensis TaxID=289483 RepID=UPI001B864DF7|nr:hypothetical protein [Pseudoxanthomonas kalamensis]
MNCIALVTAVAATGHDDDLIPLLDACADAGLHARALAWDDATVNWARFDAALLRSPWDYTERLPEFLAWCARVERSTRLLNPSTVVRWNTDKHYLADLAAAGLPVVRTRFVEPDEEPMQALTDFLAGLDADEFVIKPAISAGARDTLRYARHQNFAAGNHLARLLEQDRSAMLQPYLAGVDTSGETALLYFSGEFSHAIRKGAQLTPDGGGARQAPMALGDIRTTEASPEQRQLAERILETTARCLHLDTPLTYARVDLLPGPDGRPCLLELELTEPSLFFHQAPGSADRFARQLAETLAAAPYGLARAPAAG